VELDEIERGAMSSSARAREEGRDGAEVLRLRPLSVLVVSSHEPFRVASAMLIGRRGCTVFSVPDDDRAKELIARERIDVAVVDGAAQLRALADCLASATPAIGVVSVGEAENVALPGGPMLARWSPFEELFDALAQADRARVRDSTGAGRWSAGVRICRSL
jgi:hypothetical protein